MCIRDRCFIGLCRKKGNSGNRGCKKYISKLKDMDAPAIIRLLSVSYTHLLPPIEILSPPFNASIVNVAVPSPLFVRVPFKPA